MNKFLSRRFVLALGCGMACTGLVWFGKIDDVAFSAIIIATVGAYIGGNTWQKVSGG